MDRWGRMCEVLNTIGFWCRRPHINANQILWDSAQQKQLEPQVLPVNVITSSFYVASLVHTSIHQIRIMGRTKMPDCGVRAANSGIAKKKTFFRGVFPEREREKWENDREERYRIATLH